MTRKFRKVSLTLGLGLLLLLSTTSIAFAEGETSIFESELQNIRYNYDYEATGTDGNVVGNQSGEDNLTLAELAQSDFRPPEYKSPGKAFIYSLAVPGLGQYYSGSKWKPFLFLAVEVFGVSQAMKFHGNGEDMTAEFHAFNDEHWNNPDSIYTINDTSYAAYQAYLISVYGSLRPDLDTTLENEDRIGYTHTLPDDRTQQYYEMTGKYDQFSWGWDDARLCEYIEGEPDYENGETLRDLIDGNSIVVAKNNNIPYSANRLTYETMRDDANTEYDKGMKMVFVVMGNHLISAFEAYFATKRHNNRLKYDQPFSNIDVKPSIRTFNEWKDTPYVTLSYKF